MATNYLERKGFTLAFVVQSLIKETQGRHSSQEPGGRGTEIKPGEDLCILVCSTRLAQPALSFTT